MLNDIILYGPELLLTANLDELPYPLSRFTWQYPVVGDDVARPFSAGRYDTNKRVDAMMIECHGTIIEDTAANLATSRRDLLYLIIPRKVQPQYRHSRLLITLEDDPTTPYFADVQLDQFDCSYDVANGSPTVLPFSFSWTCNVGYWTSLVTGLPAYI